ncbi:hypothetical protein [Halalkalicoccus ordinarius]|uniref:hypothetical protein n=1 Tax=Halalkalicoccus ordinarius TaxID=3116651 RepID=UPI00300EA85B
MGIAGILFIDRLRIEVGTVVVAIRTTTTVWSASIGTVVARAAGVVRLVTTTVTIFIAPVLADGFDDARDLPARVLVGVDRHQEVAVLKADGCFGNVTASIWLSGPSVIVVFRMSPSVPSSNSTTPTVCSPLMESVARLALRRQ